MQAGQGKAAALRLGVPSSFMLFRSHFRGLGLGALQRSLLVFLSFVWLNRQLPGMPILLAGLILKLPFNHPKLWVLRRQGARIGRNVHIAVDVEPTGVHELVGSNIHPPIRDPRLAVDVRLACVIARRIARIHTGRRAGYMVVIVPPRRRVVVGPVGVDEKRVEVDVACAAVSALNVAVGQRRPRGGRGEDLLGIHLLA